MCLIEQRCANGSQESPLFRIWVQSDTDPMSYPCENLVGLGVIRQNNSNKLFVESGNICTEESVTRVIEQCTAYCDEFERDPPCPLYNISMCRSDRSYFTIRARLLVPTTTTESPDYSTGLCKIVIMGGGRGGGGQEYVVHPKLESLTLTQ